MGNIGRLLFALGVATLYERDKRQRKEIELVPTEIPDMSMNLEADIVEFPLDMTDAEFQDAIDEMSDTIDDVPEEVPMDLQHVSTQHFRIFELDGEKVIAPSWQWSRIQRETGKYHELTESIKLMSCGGATVVTLWNEETESLHTGVIVCHPNENFDKRLGRIKAYGRAVSAATRGLRTIMDKKQSSLAKVYLELAGPSNKGAMIPLAS